MLQMKKAGAIVGVVWSVDDCKELLEKARKVLDTKSNSGYSNRTPAKIAENEPRRRKQEKE